MPESVMPKFESWWWSVGKREADGVTLSAGATSTPYDSSAVPVGGKKWTLELVYSAAAPVQLALRHNHFTASKTKTTQTEIDRYALDAGQKGTKVIDFTLSETTQPNWLPSLAVFNADLTLHSVAFYETPAPSGPQVTVWDGLKEVKGTVTVWDGAREVPCTVEVVGG